MVIGSMGTSTGLRRARNASSICSCVRPRKMQQRERIIVEEIRKQVTNRSCMLARLGIVRA